jgi:hypothetical protein
MRFARDIGRPSPLEPPKPPDPQPLSQPPESCGESCCVILGFLLGAGGGAALASWYANNLPSVSGLAGIGQLFKAGSAFLLLMPVGGVAGGYLASLLNRLRRKRNRDRAAGTLHEKS